MKKIEKWIMNIWSNIRCFDENMKNIIEKSINIRTERAKNRSNGISVIKDCCERIKSKSALFSMIRVLVPAFSCIYFV